MHRDQNRIRDYPWTRQDEIVDLYHGRQVADPFRWMERSNTAETRQWLIAQERFSAEFLRSTVKRKQFCARLNMLWNGPKFVTPFKAGGRYFSWIADLDPATGVDEQAVLYAQTSLDGPAIPVLDPTSLHYQCPAAVTYQEPSPDGHFLAYAVSLKGSDWQEVRIRDLWTLDDSPETLFHCKFVGIAWAPDSSGFFYNRYPSPDEVSESDRHKYSRICWHRVGTDQSTDELIAASIEDGSTNLYPITTSDGRYLLIHLWNNGDPHGRLLYRPLATRGPFLPIHEQCEAHYNFVDCIGDTMLIQTDFEAENGTIIGVDLRASGADRWHTILPEGPDAIAFASMVGQSLLVVYLRHACHRAVLYNLDGTLLRELTLPPYCSVTGLWSKQGDPEMFLCLESFLIPPTVVRFDARTQDFAVVHTPQILFDQHLFETTQRFFTARDGTVVPIFITHQKGIALDGTHPLVLYGYGGFGTSVPPLYWLSMIPWLESGGIFAVAGIRGGGEYGTRWHRGAVRELKQTSFNDFIDASEWLVAQGYTRSAQLGILGASNGGLLVAACLVQRPELFGAAVSQVPITDMLRYQHFTVGQHLTAEFGNADRTAKEFEVLRAYSPLHNVQCGATYPAVLVTTAEYDDRAVPMHAMKFVAALQAADSKGAPHLLRVERDAGHGRGKPTSRLIAEMADILAFFGEALDVTSAHSSSRAQLPPTPSDA